MADVAETRAARAARAQPRQRNGEPLRLVLRQIPGLCIAGLLVAALWDRIGGVDIPAALTAFADISPLRWSGAAAMACLSFWAVGHYDALVHRHLATRRGEAEARRAGLLAIALGQTAGFGLLTGSLVRLRMLPGLGLAGAVRITLSVTMLFLLGWAIVTALAVILLDGPAPAPLYAAAAWAVAACLPGLFYLSFRQPRLRLHGFRPRIPTVPVLAELVGLAAIDCMAAALCLAVLMPAEAGVSHATLVPVFLIAFGAGLVSGAPGGMGAFEVTLLALLPLAPADPVLAGVLAWRVVYYALPALIALAFLARGPGTRLIEARAPCPEPATAPLPSGLDALVAGSRRAEAGILRQGDKLYLQVNGTEGGAVVARTGHSLTMIGDPLGSACPRAALGALAAAARAEGRVACLYKAGARTALVARRAGWFVAPIALEAWLDPVALRFDTPERRQLRRKLRKAKAAGLWFGEATGAPPEAELAKVSGAWAGARGGERGVSMGRFAPHYVASQRLYVARDGSADGTLLAYITLHVGRLEWTLDLMRADAGAPDGTMHALFVRALEDAAAEGCPRLSLAALSDPRLDRLVRALPRVLRPRAAGAGLGQFKRSFDPSWEQLYIAAPSRTALLLAGLCLARAIAHPPPLPRPVVDSTACGREAVRNRRPTDRTWAIEAMLPESSGSAVSRP